MKEVPLTQGKAALVDDEDYEKVSQFKWSAIYNGRTWYAVRSTSRKQLPRKLIQLHRFILGVDNPRTKIDHEDHDGLNCQRFNMRVCKQVENSRNARKTSGKTTSRFKGVYFPAREKKWRAGIRVNYKTLFLGYHKTEEDAARAYDAAAIKYFGEFAHLNFPATPQGTATLTQTETQAGA